LRNEVGGTRNEERGTRDEGDTPDLKYEPEEKYEGRGTKYEGCS
jgi:hypothetical protein